MAYTQAQLLIQLRQLLNEPVADFWTDAELNQWLQHGAVDVSTKGRCFEVGTFLTFVPLVQSYALPQDTLGVEAVFRHRDGTALAHIRHRQFGNISSGHDPRPTSYADYAGTISFFPIPQLIEDVTIAYWVSTTVPDSLPLGYQPLVVLYALKMARLKEQRYAEAMQLNSMYLSELQFQRSDLQEREPDTKATLRFVDAIGR